MIECRINYLFNLFKNFNNLIIFFLYVYINKLEYMGIGDWGLGIGDWGLGDRKSVV